MDRGMGGVTSSGMVGAGAVGPGVGVAAEEKWFPDRQPRLVKTNPETLWRLITALIVPELMDRCVVVLYTFFLNSNFLHDDN